jgi:hypothetical protein
MRLFVIDAKSALPAPNQNRSNADPQEQSHPEYG